MENNKFCKFCGEMVDKETIVCPKCGRQIEEIKQVINEPSNEIQNNKEKKIYEKEWFMWIMLIVFAPIGILFMWKFHPEIKNNIKITLTIIFGLIFLFLTINYFKNSDDNYNNLNNNYNNNNTNTNNNYNNNNSNNSDNNDNSNNNGNNNNNNNNNKKPNHYGFDETFTFDGLEITIGKDYSFDVVNNRFSDYNGMECVKLPITVKNIDSETNSLNMFDYTVFGSQGTEAETLNYYFDDNIAEAGDLRSGASYTKYLYFLYDGDGEYAIEFDNWRTKITVEFDIKKSYM